jgi:hypothetical protein
LPSAQVGDRDDLAFLIGQAGLSISSEAGRIGRGPRSISVREVEETKRLDRTSSFDELAADRPGDRHAAPTHGHPDGMTARGEGSDRDPGIPKYRAAPSGVVAGWDRCANPGRTAARTTRTAVPTNILTGRIGHMSPGETPRWRVHSEPTVNKPQQMAPGS